MRSALRHLLLLRELAELLGLVHLGGGNNSLLVEKGVMVGVVGLAAVGSVVAATARVKRVMW